jgi:hypothetical protein
MKNAVKAVHILNPLAKITHSLFSVLNEFEDFSEELEQVKGLIEYSGELKEKYRELGNEHQGKGN